LDQMESVMETLEKLFCTKLCQNSDRNPPSLFLIFLQGQRARRRRGGYKKTDDNDGGGREWVRLLDQPPPFVQSPPKWASTRRR
jgi:hypothetical protein